MRVCSIDEERFSAFLRYCKWSVSGERINLAHIFTTSRSRAFRVERVLSTARNEGQGCSSVALVLFTSIPKATKAMISCVKRAVNHGGETVLNFHSFLVDGETISCR